MGTKADDALVLLAKLEEAQLAAQKVLSEWEVAVQQPIRKLAKRAYEIAREGPNGSKYVWSERHCEYEPRYDKKMKVFTCTIQTYCGEGNWHPSENRDPDDEPTQADIDNPKKNKPDDPTWIQIPLAFLDLEVAEVEAILRRAKEQREEARKVATQNDVELSLARALAEERALYERLKAKFNGPT